jgi:ATP/ADP translocase
MSKVKKQNQKGIGFISPFSNYWNKENYIFLAIGIILLIVGYFLMGQGTWDNGLSLSLSPIVLLLAYLVFFPLSIFYRRKVEK